MRARKGQREATEALGELVRQGAITSYATNLESRRRSDPIAITIQAKDGDYLWRERLWLRVRQALEPLGKKVEIEIRFGRRASDTD